MTDDVPRDPAPLPIAEIRPDPSSGRIGIAFAPGRRDGDVPGGVPRDLESDLDAVAWWGAVAVLTLVEERELRELGISDIGEEVAARRMAWLHRPIRDFSTPDARFEAEWAETSRTLRAFIRRGGDVLIHCRGGLGRSGMVATRLLVECGVAPDEALARIRAARPGAVETAEQELWAKGGKAASV